MLVIHPTECIDCSGLRAQNVRSMQSSRTPSRASRSGWSINTEYAKLWPNITLKKEPPADAKEWEGVPDKEQYFSPNPGDGT